MKLILDAMGGDYAPQAPVEASARAARELGINIVLVGKEQLIRDELEKHTYPKDKIEIVNADDVITNHDEPAKAVRTKKNASLTVAARMLKNNEGDAMLSMGNTGAILASALLIVGRIRGIIRPALATILPSEAGPNLLIDAGANTNCKPENIVQFAIMGSIYAKNVMNLKNPSVGLISIGEEEGKGDDLTKKAYEKLKKAPVNFYGNIEGRDVLKGTANVMVCDGFVGNVILKTVEGAGSFVSKSLKGIFYQNIVTKLGALCVLKGMKKFRELMDYREYGGAPLLGIRKTVIKGHGSSDSQAVFSAIKQAQKAVETNIIDEIKQSLTKMDFTENKEEKE